MKTFRALRRLISLTVTLAALALTGGCISIGFHGSGRLPFSGSSIVGKLYGASGLITNASWYRYTAVWYDRGVLAGIDPIGYVWDSTVESLRDGEAPEHFTPEQQYYVGRGVSAALVNEYKMADTTDLRVQAQLRYLNQMAGFVNVSGPDGTGLWAGLHVGILESPKVGAFATPGGFIWITRGALDLVQSEDELAALMCHEMGHLVKEHSIKAYVKDGGGKVRPSPWIKNLDRLNPVAMHTGNYFGSMAERIARNAYTVDQEYEADQWGAVTLQLSGYDSRAMIRLFSRVDAYEAKNPDRGVYLANHPPVKDRVERLEEMFDDDKDMFKVTVSAEAKARRDARFRLVFGR